MSTGVHLSTLALSTVTTFVAVGLFLWSQSTMSLVALMLSSSTVILSYVIGFLMMAHYNKTNRDTFQVLCCNIFNIVITMLYCMLVISFLLTFCSFVDIFVSNKVIQYILYSVYSFVFVLIVIGSAGVAFSKKPDFQEVDVDNETLTM